jgi:uncharacterized heparinase superfamily protein
VSAGLVTDVRPRSLYVMVEHHHRDFARAEDVCAGRFYEVGRTLELGLDPDWLHAPQLPVDTEWQIAWSKFYWGLDLAHAFATTGEERFLHAWESLVSSWIRRVAVADADWDTSDVAARRVQNWIYAWDRFASAPGFPGLRDGLADELLDSIRAQTQHIRDHLTPARNHRTLELYALFVVGLALPDLEPGLLDLAIAELHRNLVDEMRPDGVHIEQSTHYHLVVLRSFVGARENARRYGVEFAPGYDEALSRACEFAMHCHRPDGEIPELSDADGGSYHDLLAVAADLLDRDDLRYVATGGADGREPAERNVSFPDGGYHIQRSGWDRNARFLMFDCGPLGAGGHGHYDLLSFELAAGGRPLIMDPGRYTYSEVPEAEGDPANPRHWFKGTAAHNTVCVDGLDQTPYCRGKHRGPQAEGRLLGRETAPGLDMLRAQAISPCYDALHTRRVVFVEDEYWLVEDVLEAERPHRYELRFHLSPAAQDRVEIDGWTVRAPGVALVFAGGPAPAVEPGWISPAYGVKLRAPIVTVTVDGADAHTFTTMIAPLASPHAAPAMRVRRGEGPIVVEIKGVGEDSAATDTVTWDDSRGTCSSLRTPGDGRPPVLRALGGARAPITAPEADPC